MPDRKAKSISHSQSDEAEEARLDADAQADYASGRVVPHSDVVKWLKSWGKPNELPCPTSNSPWPGVDPATYGAPWQRRRR
jgi:hypothetical protein